MATFFGPGSLAELASRDRFGDRIHLALACSTIGMAPLNGRVASWFLIALTIWGLIRTVCWRGYLPTGPRKIMTPALCWVGYLTLSLAWSSELRTGLYQIWVQPWVVLPPLLWPLMSRWRLLLMCALVGTLIQATAQSGAILIDGFQREGLAWAGFAEHPRRTAVWYAAVVTGLVLGLRTRLISNWFWLLAIAPPLSAILLASSRAALLAVVLSIPAGLLLQIVRVGRGGPARLKFAAALLVVAVLIPVANPNMLGFLQDTTTRLVESFEGDSVEDLRIAWWRSSARQWQERPVFGYGLGGTATALAADPELMNELEGGPKNKYAVFNQPHSIYFQTLIEGGVVGLGLLTWLLGTIFHQTWVHARTHPLGVVAFGGFAVWCVTAAFDQWHAHTDVLALLWLFATLAAFDPGWLSSADPPTHDDPDGTARADVLPSTGSDLQESRTSAGGPPA